MSEAACGFHHHGPGCKIRHGIGLQQGGPKTLIQAHKGNESLQVPQVIKGTVYVTVR